MRRRMEAMLGALAMAALVVAGPAQAQGRPAAKSVDRTATSPSPLALASACGDEGGATDPDG